MLNVGNCKICANLKISDQNETKQNEILLKPKVKHKDKFV
jgi:hypothetical protein